QAMERWRLQKEAQIEGMMRRGEPLGAVAAALASPETAERIAVLEAATSGRMSPVMAARLTVARAGGNLTLLDAFHGQQPPNSHTSPDLGADGVADETDAVMGEVDETGEVAGVASPFPLARGRGGSS